MAAAWPALKGESPLRWAPDAFDWGGAAPKAICAPRSNRATSDATGLIRGKATVERSGKVDHGDTALDCTIAERVTAWPPQQPISPSIAGSAPSPQSAELGSLQTCRTSQRNRTAPNCLALSVHELAKLLHRSATLPK